MFALMKKNNIAYLPTLTFCEALCEYFMGYLRGGEPHPRMVEAANAFRIAREEGVIIGCGSDVGPFPHGENLRELQWMAKLGMGANEVLLAATAVNAKILRREHELGSVKPNYLADLIVVDGDPSRDLSALKDPRFVMKRRKIYFLTSPESIHSIVANGGRSPASFAISSNASTAETAQ